MPFSVKGFEQRIIIERNLQHFSGVTNEQLGTAYVAATTASVFTALTFNRMIASRPSLAAGVVGRLVPLAAVAAANCVNIPLMVSLQLTQSILKLAEFEQKVSKFQPLIRNILTIVCRWKVSPFFLVLLRFTLHTNICDIDGFNSTFRTSL